MSKLRPEIIRSNLLEIFHATGVNLDVDDGGGNFKVNLPAPLKAKDLHDITTYQIIQYIKFKYSVSNIEMSEKNSLDKIDDNLRGRIKTFSEIWNKDMIQHIGASVTDKDKVGLFHRKDKLKNAVVIKFSHLNIKGQEAILKKLGLGVEFINENEKLNKIMIHRFDYKHK